jgi:crotonobetainyl-CoA:carnitine CoA-transferase CaiB-like acyl-CoA transferase
MQVIGRPDLADDPALAHNDGRVPQTAMIDRAISDWTGRHGMEEVLAALEAADVPSGRIYSVADIVTDPHFLARDMILPATLPGDVEVKMPGITPKLSETPGAVNWQGPTLGQHTDEVLGSMGRSSDEIARLRKSGVVQ